jgi:STE24 endopeptidase
MQKQRTPRKAEDYARAKTRVFIADLALTLAAIGAFQAFFSRSLASSVLSAGFGYYPALIIYTFVFAAFLYFIGLPLGFYSGYRIEHRFGLSTQSIGGWIKDEIKSLLLSGILTFLLVFVFYFILRNFSQTWWIIATAGWIFFTVVMARIFPVLLIPLFFKYRTVDDKGLKQDILELSEMAGIDLLDVSQIDFSRKTKKANAALAGLGGTRRVILTDTLLKDFSREEIRSVVGHEFGHYANRDVPRLLFFNSLTAMAGFYALFLVSGKLVSLTGARNIHDISLMPVLFLLATLTGLLILPFQNYYSRRREREADRFTLRLTEDTEAFISAMDKLGTTNLAERDPSRIKKLFMYDHPPLKERISMAVKFDQRKSGRHD